MTHHWNSLSAKWAQRMKKRTRRMLKSILSMEFLDQIIHLNDLEEDALNEALLSYMEKKKVSAICQDAASKRRFRQRKSWSDFQASLNDRQFRRLFRMSRECFALPC